MTKLSVSSIKLIPFLNGDTKYDDDLCNWVYQIVSTRAFEMADGDLRIVPMGDVSTALASSFGQMNMNAPLLFARALIFLFVL